MVGPAFLSERVWEFGEPFSCDTGVSPVLALFARARRPCHGRSLSGNNSRTSSFLSVILGPPESIRIGSMGHQCPTLTDSATDKNICPAADVRDL